MACAEYLPCPRATAHFVMAAQRLQTRNRPSLHQAQGARRAAVGAGKGRDDVKDFQLQTAHSAAFSPCVATGIE